jgi:hypothetical protein
MTIISVCVFVTFALSTGFCIFSWREIRKSPAQSGKKRSMLIASASIFSIGILLAWILWGLELTPWLRSIIGFHAELVTILRSCFLGLGLLLAAFLVGLFSQSGRARWLCICGSILALPYFLFTLFTIGFALAELH